MVMTEEGAREEPGGGVTVHTRGRIQEHTEEDLNSNNNI